MSSLDAATQAMVVLIVIFMIMGPFLIRRMLNPLENAASRMYAKKVNEREGDKIYYVANDYRGTPGLSPELEAAIALVPNREPQPGDRVKYGGGTPSAVSSSSYEKRPAGDIASVADKVPTAVHQVHRDAPASSPTAICPSCGASVATDIRRCPMCGSRIPRFSLQTPSEGNASSSASHASVGNGQSNTSRHVRLASIPDPMAPTTSSIPTVPPDTQSTATRSSRFCYRCGAELKEGSHFCSRCGAAAKQINRVQRTEAPPRIDVQTGVEYDMPRADQTKAPESHQASAPQQKRGKKTVISVIAVLSIALVATIAVLLVRKSPDLTRATTQATTTTTTATTTGSAQPSEAANQSAGLAETEPETVSQAVPESQPIPEAANSRPEGQPLVVSAPRVVSDESLEAGQLATWDCVWFGSYPQTEVRVEDPVYGSLQNANWDDSDNVTVGDVKYRRLRRSDTPRDDYWPASYGDYRYFRYEPIKWRVLEASGNTALVISDLAIEYRQEDTYAYRSRPNREGYIWHMSPIRSWLNGYAAECNCIQLDYYGYSFRHWAFSPDEINAILQTPLNNDDNSQYGTNGGQFTHDWVFLLSESEVWGEGAVAHGFAADPDAEDEARRCRPSEFSEAKGAYFGMHEAPSDAYYGSCGWWLRTPAHIPYYGCGVKYGGNVDRANEVAGETGAVRPALTLDLTSSFVTFAGTVSSNGAVDERSS